MRVEQCGDHAHDGNVPIVRDPCLPARLHRAVTTSAITKESICANDGGSPPGSHWARDHDCPQPPRQGSPRELMTRHQAHDHLSPHTFVASQQASTAPAFAFAWVFCGGLHSEGPAFHRSRTRVADYRQETARGTRGCRNPERSRSGRLHRWRALATRIHARSHSHSQCCSIGKHPASPTINVEFGKMRAHRAHSCPLFIGRHVRRRC